MHSSLVGSERVVARLLSALDRRRVEPLVVLPADGPLRAEVEALAVRVRVLPLSWWIPATHWGADEFLAQLEGLGERVDRLTALLTEERIDLVHTHFIVTLEGALAAARLGLPHVWHSRGLFGAGFPPPWLDDVGFFLSGVDVLADALICVSRGVEAQMATACRLARREVIYDGFDRAAVLRSPLEGPAAVRARYGITERARVVACVGGIQRRKGQLDLVEASPPLVRQFPDVVFALAGPATDREYLNMVTARIAALGLQSHFRLPGFEPSVRSLLSISEALVHPSHSEGFGVAILEAMAAGLPVVATRCGGPEEIVVERESGLLVPVGSPPALAAALRRLLADGEMARRMGNAAAERAGTFSLETTARKTEDLYGDVLASPRREAIRPLRARVADLVADDVLSRARRAATAAGPPPGLPPAPRSPRSGSWLRRLRRRFAGSVA